MRRRKDTGAAEKNFYDLRGANGGSFRAAPAWRGLIGTQPNADGYELQRARLFLLFAGGDPILVALRGYLKWISANQSSDYRRSA
jgi:hypothetical protein